MSELIELIERCKTLEQRVAHVEVRTSLLVDQVSILAVQYAELLSRLETVIGNPRNGIVEAPRGN